MNRFRLRTKIEATFGALIFIIILIVSVIAGPRMISDTHDDIDMYIRNSNGNYWDATGSNIQAAIDDLKTSGTVWLPGDTKISVSTTITVPAEITLDLGNCIITNGADVDLFKIYQDSRIINGRIEAIGMFSSDVIKIAETFSFTNLTLLEGLHITGDIGIGTGNAIHLYSETAGNCISNLQVQNIYIRGFENSILLEAYNNTWISANIFDNIWIDAPVYGIKLQNKGSDFTHSNHFTNIDIQANPVSIAAITFNEYANYFQGYIHDWNLPYAVDNSRFAVQLGGSGNYLDIHCSLSNGQTINDTGSGNTIINRGITNGSRITKMEWMYKFGRISDNFNHPDSTTCGIQEAIDDLKYNYDGINLADGGIIYIPKGTFDISSQINLNIPDLTLQGCGSATVLRIADGTDGSFQTMFMISKSNVTIRDLVIDGNSDNQASGNYCGICGWTGSGVLKNLLIENVKVYNLYKDSWAIGIKFDTMVQRSCIKNCVFENVNFGISASGNNNVVINNIFHNSGFNNACSECIVKDNIGYDSSTFEYTPCSSSNPYISPSDGATYFNSGNQTLAIYWSGNWYYYKHL